MTKQEPVAELFREIRSQIQEFERMILLTGAEDRNYYRTQMRHLADMHRNLVSAERDMNEFFHKIETTKIPENHQR